MSAPVELGRALTARETDVLAGMAEGKPNAEIGKELFISEDTVKTHARRLFRKLGARDRAHAVALGIKGGVVGQRSADLIMQAVRLLTLARELERVNGNPQVAALLQRHAYDLAHLSVKAGAA